MPRSPSAIDSHGADIVALAGFMRILGAAFVRRFDGRLVNIHPSLLPAFPGLHTHRRAIEAGCKASGATVHFVTAELDHGPIIGQAVVPVLADDDEAALAARVLGRGASPLSARDRAGWSTGGSSAAAASSGSATARRSCCLAAPAR